MACRCFTGGCWSALTPGLRRLARFRADAGRADHDGRASAHARAPSVPDRTSVPLAGAARRAPSPQLAAAGALRRGRSDWVRGQPGRVRGLRPFARDRLPGFGRDRMGRLGPQQLLAQSPLDVRRQAGAPDRPRRPLLHGVGTGVRLHLLGAGGTGERCGSREGSGPGDRDCRRDTAELPRAEALELQGLAGRLRKLAPITAIAGALVCAVVAALIWAPGATAATTVTKTVTGTNSNVPVLVTTMHKPPRGFRLTASQVERIAAASPAIRAELRRHAKAIPYEYTKGTGQWQVSWFSPGRHQVELAQVYVDDATGKVTQVWTGFQVAWTMARGYAGAFGRRLNAWYVWIPMCLLFVAPFLPWRRKPSLLHLDLLMLLGFSISLALFNHAQIGLSVPLVYPFLLYLLARMLLLAFGRGWPRARLRLIVPVSWLAVATVFLVGFRVGLNVTNSNVIDVGYAGVIGADKLLHGKPLYGHWPKDNAQGDTYGPFSYYAYVPFRL